MVDNDVNGMDSLQESLFERMRMMVIQFNFFIKMLDNSKTANYIQASGGKKKQNMKVHDMKPKESVHYN
jgi:hypothetical protein